MMDSISKLHTFSQMKPDKKQNFNLFAGFDARRLKNLSHIVIVAPIRIKDGENI